MDTTIEARRPKTVIHESWSLYDALSYPLYLGEPRRRLQPNATKITISHSNQQANKKHPPTTFASNMTWVANRKRLIEALCARQSHSLSRMSQSVFNTRQQKSRFPCNKNHYQQNPITTLRCNLINTLRNKNDTFTPKGVYRTPSQHRHSQRNTTTPPLHRPKGPCYNCRTIGHFTTDCALYKEENIDYSDDQSLNMDETPDYMNDEDPEMDQIPGPTLQPQINLAQLKAQMNALSNEEYDKLIQRMGETHPQDFLDAWSDRHWSSKGWHQTCICLAENQWTYDFTYTQSRREPKHLPS